MSDVKGSGGDQPRSSKKIPDFFRKHFFGRSNRHLISYRDHKEIKKEKTKIEKALNKAKKIESTKQALGKTGEGPSTGQLLKTADAMQPYEDKMWDFAVHPKEFKEKCQKVKENSKAADHHGKKWVTSRNTGEYLSQWKKDRRELATLIKQFKKTPEQIQEEINKEIPELYNNSKKLFNSLKEKEEGINKLDEETRKIYIENRDVVKNCLNTLQNEDIDKKKLPRLYAELKYSTMILSRIDLKSDQDRDKVANQENKQEHDQDRDKVVNQEEKQEQEIMSPIDDFNFLKKNLDEANQQVKSYQSKLDDYTKKMNNEVMDEEEMLEIFSNIPKIREKLLEEEKKVEKYSSGLEVYSKRLKEVERYKDLLTNLPEKLEVLEKRLDHLTSQNTELSTLELNVDKDNLVKIKDFNNKNGINSNNIIKQIFEVEKLQAKHEKDLINSMDGKEIQIKINECKDQRTRLLRAYPNNPAQRKAIKAQAKWRKAR